MSRSPRLTVTGGSSFRRRDFLRAVGLGGAATLAYSGRLSAWSSDASPATTEPDGEPQVGWRQPGGPTVEQVAEDLGHDPERIFRFVADEIQYDPYVGVLRGAKGTLWSRAGNSVDQAVLLAALLNESGVDTRFAVGSLDDDAAAAVREAAIVDEQTLRDRLAPVFSISREPTPEELVMASEPEIEQFIAELPERSERLIEAARGQLDDALATITTALAEAGIELPEPEVFALPDRERTEHYWVRYAAGDEWIHLDPTIPGADVGATLSDDATTMAQLSDELRHAITVTIAAEYVSDGSPSRRDLISLEAFSEDLVGHPITIGHVKPEGLAELGANIGGALDGTVQYVPIIIVGDAAQGADEWITFATEGGLSSAIDDLDVSLSGAVDSAPAMSETSATDGETLAEWIEVTVRSPDAQRHTVEREIFDRIGYVRRTLGDTDVDAVEPVDLVDVNDDAQQEYLPLLKVWSLAIAGAAIPLEFFDQDPAIDDLPADLGLFSVGQSLLRDALQVEVGAALGARFVSNKPNVTALVAGPTDVTEVGLNAEAAFDLLVRSTNVAPLDGAAPRVQPAAVTAGVLSHVAERLSLGDWRGNEFRDDNSISVGRVFEQAADDGVAVRALTSNFGAVDELAISEAARLRIAGAINRGLTVIVPDRPVRIGDRDVSGWWLVDPITGTATDELEDGRGVLEFLYTHVVEPFRRWGGLRRLGHCVAAFGPAVTAGLFVLLAAHWRSLLTMGTTLATFFFHSLKQLLDVLENSATSSVAICAGL